MLQQDRTLKSVQITFVNSFRGSLGMCTNRRALKSAKEQEFLTFNVVARRFLHVSDHPMTRMPVELGSVVLNIRVATRIFCDIRVPSLPVNPSCAILSNIRVAT